MADIAYVMSASVAVTLNCGSERASRTTEGTPRRQNKSKQVIGQHRFTSTDKTRTGERVAARVV